MMDIQGMQDRIVPEHEHTLTDGAQMMLVPVWAVLCLQSFASSDGMKKLLLISQRLM